MFWLYAAVAYFAVQAVAVWLLRGDVDARALAGNVLLIAAALTPAIAVLRRRCAWSGCQRVFWFTIAVGAILWAGGQVAWTFREVVHGDRLPWLSWFTVLNLVGSSAPLLALHARPHRGPRRADAPIIALDIAGLATIVAFFYLFFVIGPGIVTPSSGPPTRLLQWAQTQRLLLLAGMVAAAIRSRGTEWRSTFVTLVLAAAAGVIARAALNWAVAHEVYYTGSLFDAAWSLPFFLLAFAAERAPRTPPAPDDEVERSLSSTPWLIFAVVAAVPITEVVAAAGAVDPAVRDFRRLVATAAEFVLLALLSMRVAVERAARRQTEARLRMMAAAMQQTDDLALILRADFAVEYANMAFCRAVGCTKGELEAMPPERLVARDSQATFLEIARRARGGEIGRGTLTRVRRDGSTFVTQATVVPLVNRGELTHFVGLERDITDDLRRRDQMIHAERLSAVGQLVSGVAHEINNPLQTVIGFAEIMLAAEQRPESRRDLERIFREANRAGKIVRNLLSFIRRSPHARAHDDLNDIVQSTVSLRAYELRVAGIELVERYAEALPRVLVNREELQQVIVNLVLNAEQAMVDAQGRRRLTITTGRSEAAVFVDIEDDGPGVPPAIAGQIFEPFFTTKDVGKGTGLGLSIAMGIAASHGGGLALLPPVSGAGARFRLTLPAAHSPHTSQPLTEGVGASGRP